MPTTTELLALLVQTKYLLPTVVAGTFGAIVGQALVQIIRLFLKELSRVHRAQIIANSALVASILAPSGHLVLRVVVTIPLMALLFMLQGPYRYWVELFWRSMWHEIYLISLKWLMLITWPNALAFATISASGLAVANLLERSPASERIHRSGTALLASIPLLLVAVFGSGKVIELAIQVAYSLGAYR